MMRCRRGFTLVELMITMAVVAVLLTLAAPSLYDFILLQRLKSINAQLVTDMQYARSEASSRGVDVQVKFGANAALTCYSIYTDRGAAPRNKCDCTESAATRCPAATTLEIRTVQIPTSLGVRVTVPPSFLQAPDFAWQAVSGSIEPHEYPTESQDFRVDTSIDAHRTLSTWIFRPGRISVCSPGGGVAGFATCPP